MTGSAAKQSIENKNIETFYPLSPMQQGMLFHSLAMPENGVYVEQLDCTLTGPLSETAFERAWQRVVDRHPVLRTSFIFAEVKEPVQVVHRFVPIRFSREDWSALSETEQQAHLQEFLDADRMHGFDLTRPPLIRFTLIQLAPGKFHFVWSYHHILLDGWSMPIVFSEVMAYYQVLSQGKDVFLDPPRPYRDYIVWLRKQDMIKAEQYWRTALAGFTTPTPLISARPSDQTSEEGEQYAEREIWLSAEKTDQLVTFARQNNLTLSTLVNAAWGLLLSRYSGESDVVFGTTVSGRPPDLPGSEGMVGLFINTLPLRLNFDPGCSTLEWLKQLQHQQVVMRQYEYTPLVNIQGWSEVPRRLPLFESILVFENYPARTVLGDKTSTSLQIGGIQSVEQTNYPLTVIAGAAGELMLKILYDCARFDPASVERMLGHLVTLLENFAAQPSVPAVRLPMLTETERRQIEIEWNQTETGRPFHLTIPQLFEQQVEKYPDHAAIDFAGRVLSFAELNRKTNQLAHFLTKSGIGPEKRVGLCFERSPDMIVSILAVMKAGGAYVPLDPSYPRERLAFMLADSEVSLLLTHANLLDSLPPSSCPVFAVDRDWPQQVAALPQTNPAPSAESHNLAYIIYTSGSTGKPKGVLVEQRNLVNTAYNLIESYHVTPGSRALQFFSYSFDGSVGDIFMSLLTGSTLVMGPSDAIIPGPDLFNFIRDQHITHACLTPTSLAVMPVGELPELRVVITGGEVCTHEIVSSWLPGRCFINAYGPTETTVGSNTYEVPAGLPDLLNIPIGKPLPNVQVYILDEYQNLVPVGVPGEMYIGGSGVSRGYQNRPELTSERFVQDPFSNKSGARLYRSGDLVRYRPDGNIEFLGRIDQQVKIRGYRIELGEIENTLELHPQVKQAIVVAYQDPGGDKRLSAFVVLHAAGAESCPDAQQLQDLLRLGLPEYMVPRYITFVDEFPTTPAGKIDRKQLEKTHPGAALAPGRVFVEPRDLLEAQLVEIWEEILNIQGIGVTDDFFELGGHSLLAVRILGAVEQRLNRKISLMNLFQDPTIEHLAALLRAEASDHSDHDKDILVPIQPKGPGRPLYFIHPSGGSVHFYVDLAKALGKDRPFIGIQAQGINRDRPLQATIQEMGELYARTIIAAQPDGPYHIASWSLGVAIAFEVAQQLRRLGKEVGMLAMLDQGPILNRPAPEDHAHFLIQTFGANLKLKLEQLRQMNDEDQVQFVWKEARRARFIFPDVTLDQFSFFIRIMRTQMDAWRSYRPVPYPGRLVLFRTGDQHAGVTHERDLGWGEFVQGQLEIIDVPGDHLSMIHPPHVKALARAIKDVLEQIEVKEQVR